MLQRIKLKSQRKKKQGIEVIPYAELIKEATPLPYNIHFAEWLKVNAPDKHLLTQLTINEQDRLAEWMIGKGKDICVMMLVDFATNEGQNYLSIHSRLDANCTC